MNYSQQSPQEVSQTGPSDPAKIISRDRVRGQPQRAAEFARTTMASDSPETSGLAPAVSASSEGAGHSPGHRASPPSLGRSIFTSQSLPPPPRRVPYPNRCFSLGMSRVYDDTLRCHKCGGGSDFGWFYCCTNEAETRLYESIREGNIEHFDKTGEIFSKQLQRPMRGPAARADKLSLLKELEPEQLESLSGPQLAKLLKQRESANATALDDQYGFLAPAVEDRPYLTSEPQECKNTLCPRCGKGAVGEEIAILDLDGILKGDIQPTVAVGYSFRKHGRPIADAEIVRNIGLRLTPGARMDPSKPAHSKVTEKTEPIAPMDKMDREDTEDDETTLCPQQPLAPSDTFVSTNESNEDLIELYTDNNLDDNFREDDHDAVL